MITSYLGEDVYIAFTLLVCILFYSTFALHCIAREYGYGMIDWMVYPDVEIISQVLRK